MLGALIGDTVGSVYEFDNIDTKDFELLSESMHPTDDSYMSFAVLDILKHHYLDKDQIIDTFKKWGRAYPFAGYGGRFYTWIFSDMRESYGSYGNGAAMRVSPVGWFASSEEEVRKLSKLVTEVTHDHEEGLKGAEVVAMCIYYARRGKSKQFIKKYVSQYYDLNFDYEYLRDNYEFNETCQETIPQAIFCFLISTSFEDCLRTSISIGGDSDTLSAISCSIAEAYYKDVDPSLIKGVLDKLSDSGDCHPLDLMKEILSSRLIDNLENEEITKETKMMVVEERIDNKKYYYSYHSKLSSPFRDFILYNLIDQIFGTHDDDLLNDCLNTYNLNEYLIQLTLYHHSEAIETLKKCISLIIEIQKSKTFKNLISLVDELNEYLTTLSHSFKIIFFDNYLEGEKFLEDKENTI